MQILINGHKPNKVKFWIHYVWQLLLYVVVIAVVFVVSKDINNQIDKRTSSWVINPITIYDFLNNHCWINRFIFLWISIVIAIFVWKNWKNKYFSLISVVIAVVICILLLHQDTWIYATTPLPFLRYDWFISIFLIAFIIWSLTRCIRLNKEPNRKRTRKIVMTSDEIKGVKISPAREAYAKMLVRELLSSDLYKETYAVAITGVWGSGKSLFLNTIKHFCSDKAIVIEFNPWNSQDGSHLVKDFFEVLSANLSPYYGGVKKTIDKYVSLLYSLRLHVASKFVFQHLPNHDIENLDKKKKDVTNALKNIQKPIIVVIDDLDRLAGKEIFEVLRIIRNTANFNNIIYIVAYDKKHVINQLALPGLEIDKDYLEKIFQIELSMPKVDEKMLEEDFRLLCRNGVTRTSLINRTLDSLKTEDYRHILEEFSSFRKVKRFVRQFSFNANFIMESFIDGEGLYLKDVMFLNVLQSIDYRLYQTMWMSPNTLFDIKKHPLSKCQYYTLKNEDALNNYDPSVSYFMQQLFKGLPDKNPNGIQMVDAYYKYFYLSQPERVLSEKEYKAMLKQNISEIATNEMRATIRGWVLSKDSKSAPSIYACFANTNPQVYKSISDCRPFLTAIFYWMEYEDRSNSNLEEVLTHLLQTRLYNTNLHKQLEEIIMSLMNKWLYKKQFEKSAKVLSRLYVDIEKGEKLLIDSDEVKKAITTNIDGFLNSQIWDAVLLFKGDDNPMLRMAKTYCVRLSNSGTQKNLAMEHFIAYFSQPRQRSRNWKQVEKYANPFASFKVYGDNADLSIDWKEIKSIFGDNLDLATEYLEKCFNKQ